MKLSLRLTNSLSTKPRRRMGSGGAAPAFLTSVLDGGEWPVSRPCRFILEQTATGTNWVGGSVSVQMLRKGKHFALAVQHASRRYADRVITAL
jgi:hypothetical protein